MELPISATWLTSVLMYPGAMLHKYWIDVNTATFSQEKGETCQLTLIPFELHSFDNALV